MVQVLSGFAPASIVKSWVGVLCQVLKRFIANGDAGFGGFWGGEGLDRTCGDGGRPGGGKGRGSPGVNGGNDTNLHALMSPHDIS